MIAKPTSFGCGGW